MSVYHPTHAHRRTSGSRTCSPSDNPFLVASPDMVSTSKEEQKDGQVPESLVDMGEKIEVALATGEGEKREGGRLERMGERDTGASEEDDSRRGALMDGDDGGGRSGRLSWRSVMPIFIASMVAGWTMTMSNKYILSVLNFRYPIFLTTCHMGFAILGCRLIKIFAPNLSGMASSDRSRAEMSWRSYTRQVIPIGLLFSASLILSNSAVMLLSVSLVQMLKAFIPASILIVSALCSIRKLEPISIAVIFLISSGVALAAIGEVRFSLPGFICQSLAVISESLRLVMIQLLLQGEKKMDPLTSLSLYAPVCFILNLLLLPFLEGLSPLLELFPSLLTSLNNTTIATTVAYPTTPTAAFPPIAPYIPSSSISLPILLLSASVAFSLNIFTLILIQRIGGLALALGGVVKDITLIAGSAIAFGSEVRPLQVFGYGLSIAGLYAYRCMSTDQR